MKIVRPGKFDHLTLEGVCSQCGLALECGLAEAKITHTTGAIEDVICTVSCPTCKYTVRVVSKPEPKPEPKPPEVKKPAKKEKSND